MERINIIRLIVLSCILGFLIGFTTGCAAPEKGEPGIAGAPGRDGRDGRDGVDGRNGQDGQDGRDGIDAPEFSVEIIDPCGPQAQFDEVILRMMDGSLLAYFQHGNNRFLTELAPGMYETTDGTRCKFIVDDNGRVSW